MTSTHPARRLSVVPAARSPRRRRLVVLVVVVVLLLALVVVAVWRTAGDGGGESRVAVPLGGRTASSVEIDSGADLIVIGTADLGDDLAVVTTPGGEQSGVRPMARMDGERLRVWTQEDGEAEAEAPVRVDVKIARGVAWDVVVGKGARQVVLALGSGRVRAVELRGGADRAEVTLPGPSGEQVVRVPTGLASLILHVPQGVPARVGFGSGAGKSVVDGAQREGIAAGTTVSDRGGARRWRAAEDRLLVDVQAGVGALSLDRP